MPENPELVFDQEQIDSAVDASDQFLDGLEEKKEARTQLESEQQAVETQGKAELADPREADQWGLAAYAKEAQSILSGGIQDTASSITTFPERTLDAVTGEIAKERKDKGFYRPEWDPFVDEEDPITTKTWWGKLLRGTVHFGSMAAAIYGAAYAAPVTVPTWAVSTLAVGWKRAAIVGGVTDLISKESDGHNALGALRESYGLFDTPLTTKDTDHPITMKVKNILEGMGIGLAFDGAFYVLKGNKNKALEAIKRRNDSVENATVEKGLEELRNLNPEFRAAKNRPVADPWQGSYISEQDPMDAYVAKKRINTEWGAEEGSIGRLFTPVQVERIAREGDLSEAAAGRILKRLYGDEEYQNLIRKAKESRQTLVEVFGDSIESYQRITLGRDAAEMSAADFLEEMYRSKDVYDITDRTGEVVDTIETFTSKNIVVGDLLVGSLLHEIRDRGISGRELADIADLGDIDGPAAQIVDTLLTLLRETKKARIVKSQNFREIGAGKQRNALEETLTKEMADTRDSIMSILKIARDGEDPAVMNALFEVFSSMKTVNNVVDFDNWAKKMLKGGSMDPRQPKRTGALIQELGGMFTHSVLSGPKTPMRAIMGTSTATFLRPISTAFGAAMRYPFTGDSATLRSSLASLSGMIDALPESFNLFKTKLDAYWSGELSSIKTRYYDYTKNDMNWELLRRYYEDSGRASKGDQAAFWWANLIRNANNSNFFAYSTKIMAATDDSFAYILGRAKGREKAMRRVLELQSEGYKLPEINRDLMKAYEEDFYSQIWDDTGELTDEALKWGRKEVTLQTPMEGFAKGLNDVFAAHPWAKPFFLFARTGVSGLNLTAKHTPGFNFLVEEFNDIARATTKDLSGVHKYGIFNAEELANAKALQTGRLGLGSLIVMMTAVSAVSGNITGNGPVDRQKRQGWIDGGFRPRQIKIGGAWVGYDSVEPFNLIFSTIADIRDASLLMGDEWTENQLQKVSLVIAQALTSKSYFSGLQQMVDMVAGRPGQQNRIVANIMNNQIPLAGLRNDLGKLFTPHMRELNSGIGDALRNRNLISEYLPGDDLPIKYDILNGKPVRDYDFLTRAYNTFSPISLNLDYSEGRQFLFNSGYDLRLSVFSAPGNIDLSDHPRIRSMFQKAIGEQNLEYKLTRLARSPKAQASLREMNVDIKGGDRGNYDPMDYYHNMKIDQYLQDAKRNAWASIMNDPRVKELRAETLKKKQMKYTKQQETRNIQPILNMYK